MSDLVIRPKSADERFMLEVYLTANTQSKDPRTKIGAVIVKEDDIISTGYNNFPRKVLDLKSRYLDSNLKKQFVVHAEANAVHNCARKGIACLSAKLYTQGVPCSECAKVIIQAGISEVIVHKQWPSLNDNPKWRASNDLTCLMFRESGIKLTVFDKFINTTGLMDDVLIYV